MSRVYDDKPLKSIPVSNYVWHGVWNSSDYQEGKGVLLEGIIRSISKNYLSDNQGKEKHRYLIFHLEVKLAHRRQFDSSGHEIEPNFGKTTKVSKGFLMSSYTPEARGKCDELSKEELRSTVEKPGLVEITKKQCPSRCMSFWIAESEFEGIEMNNNDSVRLKTLGDGPFIGSIVKLEEDTSKMTSNYTGGENVGNTWTDKVMAAKSNVDHPENEGVDEDEWDD